MSKIDWTELTLNVITGCTKKSAGCKHCYAETKAKWLQGMGTPGYENGFKLSLLPDRMEQPRRRKKPTMYFLNSMSDTFHEGVPFEYIDQIMGMIGDTPQHTYQILTKRAERMREYFATRQVPENVWLGVTVENQKEGKPRMAELKAINCPVRFLSVEPLLEDLGVLDLSWIHQVIVGGENAKRARPMQSEWVDNVHHWCQLYHVPFFFKQWGSYGPDGVKRSKQANGREYKGQVWDGYPHKYQSLQKIPVVTEQVQPDLFQVA